MNAKQMAALCSVLGLTLSVAAHADSACGKEPCPPVKKAECCPAPKPVCPKPCPKPCPAPKPPCPPKPCCERKFEQGSPLGDGCFPEAYSKPAGIKLMCTNDFYVSASFIYWMASSDGFNDNQFPFSTSLANSLDTLGDVNGGGSITFMKPKFKPGFKVGIGYTGMMDNWSTYLEYTWLHQSTHHSASAGSANSFVVTGYPYNIGGTSLNSHWHLHLDMGDLSWSRAFYSGKRLTIEPMLGIRAAWIHQKYSTNLSTNPASVYGAYAATHPLFQTVLNSSAESKSWGLGVRAGANSHWLLGYGFRIDGKASASALFTRYTEIGYSGVGNATTQAAEFSGHYDTVRPNAELGLGLGWGWYSCEQDYHFDLSLTYDFNIFWSQNMLRGVRDAVLLNSGAYPTDLVYQGPTLTARLDF